MTPYFIEFYRAGDVWKVWGGYATYADACEGLRQAAAIMPRDIYAQVKVNRA